MMEPMSEQEEADQLYFYGANILRSAKERLSEEKLYEFHTILVENEDDAIAGKEFMLVQKLIVARVVSKPFVSCSSFPHPVQTL